MMLLLNVHLRARLENSWIFFLPVVVFNVVMSLLLTSFFAKPTHSTVKQEPKPFVVVYHDFIESWQRYRPAHTLQPVQRHCASSVTENLPFAKLEGSVLLTKMAELWLQPSIQPLLYGTTWCFPIWYKTSDEPSRLDVVCVIQVLRYSTMYNPL